MQIVLYKKNVVNMVSIKHQKTASPTNKASCDDWNADHEIKGEEIIYEENFKDVSSITINLDGEKYDSIEMIFCIDLGYNGVIGIKPNNTSTNVFSRGFGGDQGGDGNRTSDGYLKLCGFGWDGNSYASGRFLFFPKKGVFRRGHVTSNESFIDGSKYAYFLMGTYWNNTADALTSLYIYNVINVNFSGYIKLIGRYKV